MSSPSSEMGSAAVSPPAASVPVTNGSATAAAVDEDLGDDLFGDDDDAPKPMDGVEQVSTGSASPAAERARPPPAAKAGSSSSSNGDSDREDDQPDDGLTPEERRERRRLEYDEDDDEDGDRAGPGETTVRELTTVQVHVNKWEPLEGTNKGERYTIRLPKQILHETTPYSQANYHEPDEPTVEGEDDGESKLNPKEVERRKAETLLHQVEHTMRWRWVTGPDGQPVKQSNTRIIRWSDGSLSLQLGPPSNLFDIVSSSSHAHKPLHPSNPTVSHAPAHPTTYIVAHHQEAELLQSEGPITAKLTLVPANLKGDMHQKLAKSVKGRNEKGSRLKIWDEKTMTAVMGDDGAKPTKAKRAKKAPGASSGGGRRAGGGGGGGRRRGGKRSGSIDSEDEESEDEEEMEERRRKAKGKAAARKKGDDSEEGRYKEDGFVVDDSDDAGSDGPSKKRKSSSGKGRRASPTMSSDEEELAVESEEDEEVEPEPESEEMESEEEEEEAGGGEQIKKRRIVLQEDEDDE